MRVVVVGGREGSVAVVAREVCAVAGDVRVSMTPPVGVVDVVMCQFCVSLSVPCCSWLG